VRGSGASRGCGPEGRTRSAWATLSEPRCGMVYVVGRSKCARTLRGWPEIQGPSAPGRVHTAVCVCLRPTVPRQAGGAKNFRIGLLGPIGQVGAVDVSKRCADLRAVGPAAPHRRPWATSVRTLDGGGGTSAEPDRGPTAAANTERRPRRRARDADGGRRRPCGPGVTSWPVSSRLLCAMTRGYRSPRVVAGERAGEPVQSRGCCHRRAI